MKTEGGECMDTRCKASKCVGPMPITCPPGCPKQNAVRRISQTEYRDIHAASSPGHCLDFKMEKPGYPKPRPFPPGSKPIPPKPPGGAPPDKCGTETFLDTFDCQEQPVWIFDCANLLQFLNPEFLFHARVLLVRKLSAVSLITPIPILNLSRNGFSPSGLLC